MAKISWLAFLLAGATLFGQAPSQADGDKPASVEGAVVNAATGEPLVRAHIMMRGATRAGKQVRYGAITDVGGKFSITALPPGTYSAQAERVGFVTGSSGWPGSGITLGAGDSKTGIKLQLMPFGSISGRVLDATGEPVGWVHVSAEGPNGAIGSGGTTDDQGAYRIPGLRPGRYRVKATPETAMLPPETRSDGSVETNYIETFHPNTTAPSAAVRVSIQPGSEVAGIDIRLVQGPIVRVSGTVRDVPGDCGRVGLDVRRDDRRYGGPIAKADGSFAIWRLPAGSYTLSASCLTAARRLMRASPVEFEIGNNHIEHIDLRLLPPAEVAVRVEYDGDELQPRTRQIVFEDTDHQVSIPSVDLGPENAFRVDNLPAGRYRIRVSPPPAYVKSVRVGQSAMEGGILDLRNGASSPVTLTLSGATGGVAGTVTGDSGPAAAARVMLIPEDANSGLFATLTTSTPSGAYTFRGIRPGRYKLVALDAADDRGLDDLDDLVEHVEVSPRDQLLQDLTVPSQFQIGVRR